MLVAWSQDALLSETESRQDTDQKLALAIEELNSEKDLRDQVEVELESTRDELTSEQIQREAAEKELLATQMRLEAEKAARELEAQVIHQYSQHAVVQTTYRYIHATRFHRNVSYQMKRRPRINWIHSCTLS